MPNSPLTLEVIAAFISKSHLLNGASEDVLFAIAENLKGRFIEKGTKISDVDKKTSHFYFLYSGTVAMSRPHKNKGKYIAVLSSGDYLGEDALLKDEPLTTELIANENSLLLELSADAPVEIPEALGFLKKKIQQSLHCRALAYKLDFDWIMENEVIHFFVRKHKILFWKRLPFPVFTLLAGFVSFFLGMWYGLNTPFLIGGTASIVAILWFFWNWIDWRNDYYIVTNQRVIWEEKVMGIYDSRQIAHFPEVQAVNVQTEVLMNSVFDYGHVTVNTIFDSIEMLYMPCPNQAKLIIEELWERAQHKAKKEAKEELHKAIQDQIKAARALETKKKSAPSPPPPPPPPKKKTIKDFLPKKKKSAPLLQLRFEEGKELIYRKHFVILFKNTAIPSTLMLGIFGLFFYQIMLYIIGKRVDAFPISVVILLAVGGLVTLGWLYYQYIDWSNDIFKVSDDKIFDIDRKPLGDEQSRSAPLENIEGTEYKRIGLLSVLFNFGTVYIHIGSESFEFEDVLDPASVQQDINRRYMALHEKKKKVDAKKERDQMIKWLVAYYESTEEFEDMMEIIRRQEEEEAAAAAALEEEAGTEG